MNHYNVGDCLVCKTGVIEITGKFSKGVYKVVKYSKDFLSSNIRGYNVYQLDKYFKRCTPEVIYKADKLLKMNLNIVNNIVKASKATRKAKGFIAVNSHGYLLGLRVRDGWWKHTNVNYDNHHRSNTWSWEYYYHSTPIYVREYETLNTYLSTLKESLTELWQSIKILSE